MDGLLAVDKPAGPTSHDVVAAVRRLTGERRIGHAGTLDPMASGVLVLLLGRATRLARYYAASRKTYLAGISFSGATDTYDAEGTPQPGARQGAPPDTAALLEALERFRGTFTQVPPPFSAKKVGGVRAYEAARRARPVALAPIRVTVYDLSLASREGPGVELRLVCSAGFYVRSLAHDLGTRLGCGAHLTALRRTASGSVSLEEALPLADLEARPTLAVERLRPLAGMLEWLPGAIVTSEAAAGIGHGRAVPPAGVVRWVGDPPGEDAPVRLLGPGGTLLAVAGKGKKDEALQPTVVLA